jgi:hypothetical protein
MLDENLGMLEIVAAAVIEGSAAVAIIEPEPQ